MEHSSALKRTDILSHAATWKSPEDITLHEMSQPQGDKYRMIPLTYKLHRGVKFKDKKYTGGCGGGSKWELLFNGYGVSVSRDKNMWR